jgi:hypothetical protein
MFGKTWKIISGQKNTQPIQWKQIKGKRFTKHYGKKQQKQSKRLINTYPTKTGCELM